MLTTLAISNYRSLRELLVPLKALNVITGPNGSGKSSPTGRCGFLPIRHKAVLSHPWHGRVGCSQPYGPDRNPFRARYGKGISAFKEQLENSLSVFALALRETSLPI